MNVETVAIQAGGIVLSSDANGGSEKTTVTKNIFQNLSGTGDLRSIHINPVADMVHHVNGNKFIYENGLSPQFDIFYLDGTGIRGDIYLSGNDFFDTGAANVRGTTVNHECLYIDDGTNINARHFTNIHYFIRDVKPLDTRFYVQGTVIYDNAPVVTVGGVYGFINSAAGSPGTFSDLRNG